MKRASDDRGCCPPPLRGLRRRNSQNVKYCWTTRVEAVNSASLRMAACVAATRTAGLPVAELSLSWIRRRFRGWHMANWCSTCWWHMAKWWSTCTCNFSLSKSQPTSTASAGKFIPSTTSAGEFIIIIQVSWNPGCGTPETSEYTARWPSMPQENRLPIREDSSSPRPWPWCHSIWVQFWTGLTENVDFQTAIEHAAIQGLSQFIEVLWCTMANWHFTMQLPIGNNQIKVWFCWQVVVYHFQIFSRVFSVN